MIIKKYSIVFVLLISLVAGVCYGEDQQNQGNAWLRMNNDLKYTYTRGYQSGYLLALVDVIDQTGQFDLVSNIESDLLVDGINVFYADFKNRVLTYSSAFRVVVQQISGVDQKIIDKYLEDTRSQAIKPKIIN